MARPQLPLLVVASLAAALLITGLPAGATAPGPDNPWTKVENPATAGRAAAARPADVRTTRFAAFTLDRAAMQTGLTRVSLAPQSIVTLPTPAGDFQRFQLTDSPVMESGLAAAHPEIRTYAGKGVDDPTATVRADLTPLGFHASVRSRLGAWYVDPYYHLDQSLYASYYGHDLASPGPLVENEEIEQLAQDIRAGIAEPVVKLRTYRLALVTDPSYATFFGAENVTAAKVTLINRVTQIYEDETAIRLVLINDTDKTNLNTAALATGPNGPCGAAPCYTAAQLAGCSGGLLTRNNFVLGQLVGASNYDIGHIGLGVNGGGVAGLGVVGGATKGRGCTGLPTPVGDFYAVDYVAHEMGHQFGGNHPFNGTQLNCSGGNRSAANSVEPGSGTSIMAYAGICQQDNLQPHSDPYWSQRSFAEITTYVTSTRPLINEVQNAALREFDTDGDSFSLMFGGQLSAPIVRGVNYTTAGIKAVIEGIRNWPAGATVTVTGFGGAATLDDTGFQVTFNGGAVAGTNQDSFGIANATGVSGFVGETVKGGAPDNGGHVVTDTTNHAPVVTVPASFTIPVRTPFALTGSATDADGDALTYMWEQNDRGGATGTALTSNVKTNGPLFRQFGTAAIVSAEDTLKYYSPGENTVTADPTRVFPDLKQIAAGNTNAVTGACPPAPAPPAALPPELVDCYSEFLPTADWVGVDNTRTLHFRLTARDGRLGGGGVGSADTALTLAPDAGPFLVTSQGTAATFRGGVAQPVTWNVAGTAAAPVGATDVKISLSTDGGATFPYVLAERTPNDGNEIVTLPDLATTHARIKVEAVGNVFFDLNDADLTILASPRLTNSGPTTVQYSDSPNATVSATDPDSAGPDLTAAATGLPAGLSLAVSSTSDTAARPGLRAWAVTGTTTATPGDYPVSIAITDDTGITSTTALTIRVTPEDAEATYTGDALTFARDNASVLLRATIRDNSVLGADTTPGDIRTATVTFLAGTQPLCTATPGILETATTTASANCTATLPVGTRDITVQIGGNYTAQAPGQVSVIPSQNRIAIAATTQPATNSAGTFRADPGTPISTALLVAHTRIGGLTASLTTAGFQSGAHHYQILAAGAESLGATPGALDLRAHAALLDVTDPLHPTAVAAGTLRITATNTRTDTLGLTLMDGNHLLFSSSWTGATTTETPITAGNLLIV